MQTRPIASLIRKFENQEFSKPPYISNKKVQFNYENQIKKVTKLNSIFDSSGTLYSSDNNRFSNDDFKSKLERNGKLSKELLEVFQKSNDNNNAKNLSFIDNNYPIHKNKKLNISNYKESTETLINSSNENVFKSTISFNITKDESSQSLPPFKTKNSVNELLKSNFSLSKLDPKENIEENKLLIRQKNEKEKEENKNEKEKEKGNEEKEEENNEINDEKKNEGRYEKKDYDNFSEKKENNKNIDSTDEDEAMESDINKKHEEKNDALSKNNENNLSDENFHSFDVNTVLRNIIRVDVNRNDQKKENCSNESNSINNNEDKNHTEIKNFDNKIIITEKEITNATNLEKHKQIENHCVSNALNESNERLKSEDNITSDGINVKITNKLQINLPNNEDTENLYVVRDLKKEETLLGFDEEKIETNNQIKIREKDKLDNKNKNDNDKNKSFILKQENHNTKNSTQESNVDKEEKSYKEKIIDKRYKLTYVLARGGCGEIRATEDLVTGEQVSHN